MANSGANNIQQGAIGLVHKEILNQLKRILIIFLARLFTQ